MSLLNRLNNFCKNVLYVGTMNKMKCVTNRPKTLRLCITNLSKLLIFQRKKKENLPTHTHKNPKQPYCSDTFIFYDGEGKKGWWTYWWIIERLIFYTGQMETVGEPITVVTTHTTVFTIRAYQLLVLSTVQSTNTWYVPPNVECATSSSRRIWRMVSHGSCSPKAMASHLVDPRVMSHMEVTLEALVFHLCRCLICNSKTILVNTNLGFFTSMITVEPFFKFWYFTPSSSTTSYAFDSICTNYSSILSF